MIVKNPKFEISAVKPAQYPQNELPQIVLVGKSNVGKSSFINSMLNRKKLARTSSEPGKTRQINFYNIDEKFYFVDLPGYGYSKMSKEEQARVGSFIEEYLSKSDKIALIVFLIDIRHEPSQNDRLMYNYIINTNSPCLVIANKADKIAVTKVDNAVQDLQNSLNPLKDLTFMPFSSERKIYSEKVWNFIEKYI
ncbi:probable GTP-binding protein EngB [Clostridium sp. CAG:780]|nr:probable GTP-binding protein EngB [Clostridium sp. CAG:780]